MPTPADWREFESKGKSVGLTQKQLAEMIGTSPRYLRKLKSGERTGSEIVQRPHCQAGLYQVQKKLGPKDATVSRYVRIPESNVQRFMDEFSGKLQAEIDALEDSPTGGKRSYRTAHIKFVKRQPSTRVKVRAL